MANAEFALALVLVFHCPVVDAFAFEFVFDSFAFAIAFAVDSNAFDWNQMHLIQMHLIGMQLETTHLSRSL